MNNEDNQQPPAEPQDLQQVKDIIATELNQLTTDDVKDPWKSNGNSIDNAQDQAKEKVENRLIKYKEVYEQKRRQLKEQIEKQKEEEQVEPRPVIDQLSIKIATANAPKLKVEDRLLMYDKSRQNQKSVERIRPKEDRKSSNKNSDDSKLKYSSNINSQKSKEKRGIDEKELQNQKLNLKINNELSIIAKQVKKIEPKKEETLTAKLNSVAAKFMKPKNEENQEKINEIADIGNTLSPEKKDHSSTAKVEEQPEDSPPKVVVDDTLSVEERTIKWAQDKNDKLNWIRESMKDRDIEECTFKPVNYYLAQAR